MIENVLIRSIRSGRHLHALGVAACFAWASWASAQPADQQESIWYQVEVVIFERLSGNSEGDRETWPKDIGLAYPSSWQKLISPQRAEALMASLNLPESTLDAPHADDKAPEQPSPAETFRVTPEPLAGIPESAATEALVPAEPLPPLLTRGAQPEFAYVRLPESERTLNESTAAIARDRKMRVLFHEAWRQPLRPDGNGSSIIINGGNAYEQHHELEGSLHLSLSRYLHLQTNLWLSEFIPNYGQDSEHWPPLPPVPERAETVAGGRPAETPEERLDPTFGTPERKSVWEIDTTAMQDYTSLISQPFLVTQIMPLQQSRRMRSGELHYIDHPRLGLLIKIDEYEPEQEQEQEQE